MVEGESKQDFGRRLECALGRTTVETAARAYVPYMITLLLGLLLVAFVPWITLVVPRLMKR